MNSLIVLIGLGLPSKGNDSKKKQMLKQNEGGL